MAAASHRGRVVVGVDGSADMTTVGLAAREANLRRRPLHVVHGFIWPYLKVPLDAPVFGPQEGGLRNEAERIVGQGVAHAHELQPTLDIIGEVVTGTGAQMVVLGARGLGGFTGLLLGSVSQAVLHHAACTTAIVSDRWRRRSAR